MRRCARATIGVVVWLAFSQAPFVFGNNTNTTVDSLINALSGSSQVSSIKMGFRFSSKVYLRNYAIVKLETFSNNAALHHISGARILRAESNLLAYAESPNDRIRSERRQGEIVIAGNNAKMVSSLISADRIPPFDRTAEQRVSVLTSNSYTDLRIFAPNHEGQRMNEANIVDARPGDFQEMGLPFMFTANAMISTLRSLINVRIDTRENTKDNSAVTVTGMNHDTGYTFKIFFNRALLPVRLVIVDGSEKLADIEIRCRRDRQLGAYVTHEVMRSYKDYLEDYMEDWWFTNYVANAPISSGSFRVSIPMFTLVNDYRFSKPFTYIMGQRPPSEQQLIKMSQNPSAIQKYYNGTGAEVLGKVVERNRTRRFEVFSVFVISTLAFLLVIKRGRKR